MKITALITLLALCGCAQAPEVDKVNHSVNTSMRYLSDIDQYGVSDVWNADCPQNGDCEDYALCKMRLLGGGNIVLCKINGDTDHAILSYRGLYLDNRYNTPLTKIKCENPIYLHPQVTQEMIKIKGFNNE